MKKPQTNIAAAQTHKEKTLWHELDEQTSETISGGAEGCLAWSIRYGDVRRSQSSDASIFLLIL